MTVLLQKFLSLLNYYLVFKINNLNFETNLITKNIIFLLFSLYQLKRKLTFLNTHL